MFVRLDTHLKIDRIKDFCVQVTHKININLIKYMLNVQFLCGFKARK